VAEPIHIRPSLLFVALIYFLVVAQIALIFVAVVVIGSDRRKHRHETKLNSE
jgi:hypothetical protein